VICMYYFFKFSVTLKGSVSEVLTQRHFRISSLKRMLGLGRFNKVYFVILNLIIYKQEQTGCVYSARRPNSRHPGTLE
jgi:hypothetical protein